MKIFLFANYLCLNKMTYHAFCDTSLCFTRTREVRWKKTVWPLPAKTGCFTDKKILSVQICDRYPPLRRSDKFTYFLLMICPDDDTRPTAPMELTVGSCPPTSAWVLQCHTPVGALLTHITPLYFNTFFITCCWFIQKNQFSTQSASTKGAAISEGKRRV